MSISPEDALEREDSPASSLIGGSEGGKLAEYEEIAARAYDGFVVRKDLVGQVKGNAIVPSYVLEFLLAQYCATTSESAIIEGVESVRRILARHYVNRGDSELIKSRIYEAGQYRIIDKVSVTLDDIHDRYSATFENLGITNALVSDATVRENDRLLTGGVWCMADVSYVSTGDTGAKATSPWIVSRLQAIQLPRFDFDRYCRGRASFSADQWIDLLVASVGLDPAKLSRRAKLFQLTRLVPYVERNYNLVELGPKGTGKSHIYSEFSPHGILVSGGEVTLAKLFVNNATRRIGLVGYWDVVAFDEFAGRKRVEYSLVDMLKNYLANKSFSRGDSTITAEASMVFVGNTTRTVPAMLASADLFEALPEAYHDTAYMDRIHYYLPGWEVDIVRPELFSRGYGLIVDYLAEALRHLRTLDYIRVIWIQWRRWILPCRSAIRTPCERRSQDWRNSSSRCVTVRLKSLRNYFDSRSRGASASRIRSSDSTTRWLRPALTSRTCSGAWTRIAMTLRVRAWYPLRRSWITRSTSRRTAMLMSGGAVNGVARSFPTVFRSRTALSMHAETAGRPRPSLTVEPC